MRWRYAGGGRMERLARVNLRAGENRGLAQRITGVKSF